MYDKNSCEISERVIRVRKPILCTVEGTIHLKFSVSQNMLVLFCMHVKFTNFEYIPCEVSSVSTVE
jgi:hypothetical protein